MNTPYIGNGGTGTQNSFMGNMKKQGLIDKIMFTMYFGRQSNEMPGSSIWFGGYDY